MEIRLGEKDLTAIIDLLGPLDRARVEALAFVLGVRPEMVMQQFFESHLGAEIPPGEMAAAAALIPSPTVH